MKRTFPAHRRDELVPARQSSTAAHATPALQLASIIGNKAMHSLLTRPTVQRSLWDDVTGAVAEVSGWFGGGAAAQEQQPAPNIPPSDPGLLDDAFESAHEQGSQDMRSPAEVRDQAGGNDAADEGSWFENWFGEQEQPDEVSSVIYIEPESSQPDECAQLEAEIANLSEYIQRLYDESQALLPELEALKAQSEALERSAPGTPESAEARQRYEELHQRYNMIVDECLYLMEMRNNLRLQLEDCRARQKSGPQPMPEYL